MTHDASASGSFRALLPLLGLMALCLPGQAWAASSSAGEEYLSIMEAVEPNILFLIDLSEDMDDPCEQDSDTGSTTDTAPKTVDTAVTDTAATKDTAMAFGATASTTPCIESVIDAIDQITQHYDWARYGVIGTADAKNTNTYYPIVPIGTSYAELSAALATVSSHGSGVRTRNLSEALAGVADGYLSATDPQDEVDDDGDGFDMDWDEAAIDYWCQETHIIVITLDRPIEDDKTKAKWGAGYSPSVSPDVICDKSGITTSPDALCMYDNTVYSLYSNDFRSDLSGDQSVTVHTLGIKIDGSSVAENLFGNASDLTGGAGVYTNANSADDILSGLLLLMRDIRSGTYSRSTPVISASGNYLVYTFYELTGDSILAEGHIRAYAIEDDPTSASYGQVDYTAGSSDYGYAIWDGGNLLVSRPVTSAEDNPDDRDGFGKRDIYTFWEPAVSLMSTESTDDRRQGFDIDFVSAGGGDATALSYVLDTTLDATNPPCGTGIETYDLDKDGCLVDDDDLQAMVDFVRGLPEAEFKNLDEERGTWKLGDSPHSVPVVVEARNNTYAIDPTYRKYLTELEKNRDSGISPDIVLVAANDGMLHAFALEDSAFTTDSDEGEELWAWIPGTLIYRDDYRDAEWSGGLLDLLLYGRTFLFDGSPVVEDVWIDTDGDGARSCTSVPDDCEWRRVVVVQQGKGGPVTLALDITTTMDPKFLWEQTDESDSTAMGYTTGRPVIAPIYDNSGSTPVDRYITIWGSGRGVPYGSSFGSSYYSTAEGNLYIWGVGDDYWDTDDVGYQEETSGDAYARGSNGHPESSSLGSVLDSDSDTAGHYEYAYISAALAVVDVDSDGDADTIYFPITASYKPTDEGGLGVTDTSDPGSTWMYKACLDSADPGVPVWAEFFDPIDDGGLSTRPEVYYAATTAWHTDGSLGVYWGTGTPYDRTSSDSGYFFAVKDDNPGSCTSFNANPITDCGAGGVYTFDAGEGLTSDPLVYAGTVYFSTWVPETDRCDGGTGRLYGLAYDDCDAGMDTDGDGDIDSDDEPYVEEEDAYISGVVVTDKGTILYGTSNLDKDTAGSGLGVINVANDPFLGTATISWFEIF